MKSGGGGRVKLGDSQNDQCVTLQQIRCHEVGRTGDLVRGVLPVVVIGVAVLPVHAVAKRYDSFHQRPVLKYAPGFDKG